MTKPRPGILVLLAFLLSIPLNAQTMKSTDSTAAKEIRLVLLQQADAWNSGNIDGYMEGYWKSDSLLFTSGGNIQRGWQATLKKYRKSYGTKAEMGTLKFSQLGINLLSSESAWVLGHWELVRQNDHPEGVFTLILRKFPDGWKIIHDHTSSNSKLENQN
jgi:ketosteroid isomerase-like protein